MLCPLWSYSLSAYEQKQETSLYQAGLSGLQGRGKGQSGKLLIWTTEQSHASTSLQKSSGITWLTWSSSSCSCGCVESEFFRITEFTAVLLQWQGIWRILGKQQAALYQICNKELEILMLPSLKYRRQMEIENSCVAQNTQKSSGTGLSHNKKQNWYNLFWNSETKPWAWREMLTDIFTVLCRWESRNSWFWPEFTLEVKLLCSPQNYFVIAQNGAILFGPILILSFWWHFWGNNIR